MILTSYFANYRVFPENRDAVSISRFPPRGFKGKQELRLAPSAKLLQDYKAGAVNEEQYTERYNKETLSTLDPREIAILHKNSIFLCYEKAGDFCHRQLVATWLRKAGFDIEELRKN